MNSPNHKGFTASDLLAQSNSGSQEKTTVVSTQLNEAVVPENCTMSKRSRGLSSHRGNRASGGYNWKKHFKKQNSWVERMRNSLMVVATLTATMTFQAGLNPPAGVWQDNPGDNSTSVPINYTSSILTYLITPGKISHVAGVSIMADTYHSAYFGFLVLNTIGFIASLSIIILLISGLPIRRRFFMCILTVIMWIVITSMALSYTISISILSPGQTSTSKVLTMGIIAWIGLMTLLVISHTIRLIVKALRACWKAATCQNGSVTV